MLVGGLHAGKALCGIGLAARTGPGCAKTLVLLAALPSLQLRFGPSPAMRKVDKLSCVRIGLARYSVPMPLIGARVQLDSCSAGC